MALSPDMVAKWTDSFLLTAYISDTMDHNYNPAPLVEDNTDISNGSRHKPERKKKRKILLYIRPTPNLTRGTSNISHPLESRSPQLYNISNVWLCKSRSRQGECCRFTRNRRDNDYIIQGIYSPPTDGDLPRDVEVK